MGLQSIGSQKSLTRLSDRQVVLHTEWIPSWRIQKTGGLAPSGLSKAFPNEMGVVGCIRVGPSLQELFPRAPDPQQFCGTHVCAAGW